MTGLFGPVYSDAYDSLYRDKNYEGECDAVERLLGERGIGRGARLLDLGCGTGSHALPLAQRGYGVTGLDRSESMLARARAKASALHGKAPAFLLGDVRDFALEERFDAALMMFAVLGYQCSNADLLATLRTVRRHLVPGGLFVFDVWYGPAVLADRPGQRVRRIDTPTGRVIRTTTSTLDANRQSCRVLFELLQIDGDRVVGESREEHLQRFFFPLELDLALAGADLRLEALRAFPDIDRDPGEDTWNVIAVARAVPEEGA